MAIADMGGAIHGKKIELLTADHQNKADIAAAKAREWFDTQGLDVLIGGTNSGTSLAMAKIAADKKKPFIAVGAASSALTNEQCTPYTVHYAYDTVALAKGTGGAVVKAVGRTPVLPDGLLRLRRRAAERHCVGGQGRRRKSWAPSSTRCRRATSLRSAAGAVEQGADLGLANAGVRRINSIKAANEFGITKTMKLAGLLLFINDVHSVGLEATQGMYLTTAWYWNQSPESRTWARRFFAQHKRMPSFLQAGDYSAATQYLSAVKATGSDDADKVLAQMRKTPINDMFAKGGTIRADGRMVHDMYLAQVKTPAQSKEPWDYYNIVSTIKGDDAWTIKADSKCALWK